GTPAIPRARSSRHPPPAGSCRRNPPGRFASRTCAPPQVRPRINGRWYCNAAGTQVKSLPQSSTSQTTPLSRMTARPLHLMVYRHSAIYSPMLAGIAGGFFAREGFAPTYTVMPPGREVGDMLASGEIHVSQASVSTSWAWLDQGRQPPLTVFATLNRRDGFFIAAREVHEPFDWQRLPAGKFVYAHGG